MSSWIVFGPDERETLGEAGKKEVTIRGVKTELLPSPYDIPHAVRGVIDPSTSRVEIEFKYLGDEQTTQQRVGKDVIMRVGRNSHRLYGLELDPRVLGSDPQQIGKNLTGLVERLSDTDSIPEQPGNYRIAAVALQKGDLLQQMRNGLTARADTVAASG